MLCDTTTELLLMQPSGTIKQIYLDAILAGSKVEEEIEKSSCGRHVRAIVERQAHRPPTMVVAKRTSSVLN